MQIAKIHEMHRDGLLVDRSVLPQPIRGRVKMTFEIKDDPTKGPSQGFILEDGTGEIVCNSYPGNKEAPWQFAPVRQGDEVEVAAVQGQRGMVGVTKGTIGSGQNAGKPKLNVYGPRHLKNLSGAVATQPQAYGQQQPTPAPQQRQDPTWMTDTAPAQSRPTGQSSSPGHTKLGESKARRLYLRQIFEVGAAIVDAGTLEEVVQRLPPHVYEGISRFANSVLMGVEKGDIAIEEGQGWSDGANPAGGDPWGA